MSKVTCISVSLLIVVLDAGAGYFSLSAKTFQNQAEHSSSILECKERSHDAFIRVVVAALLLLVAHITANLLGFWGAYLRDQTPEQPRCRLLYLIFLFGIWFFFGAAEALLVIPNKSNEALCRFAYRRRLLEAAINSIGHAPSSIAYCFASGVFQRRAAALRNVN